MTEARVEGFTSNVDLEGRGLKPKPHDHSRCGLSFWALRQGWHLPQPKDSRKGGRGPRLFVIGFLRGVLSR